jgi:DNA-directed RNA polymerase subunit RPC12/RpoP
MADMKFSCPQCGQHISCGEPWAGHQIQCPGCHSHILVPQVQAPSAPPPASVPAREASKTTGPKLTYGATQVPRSTAPAPVSARRFTPGPPRSDNALLKYGVLLVVVVVLAGVGYFYGLPLLTNVLQPGPDAKSSTGAKTSQSGGAGGGPMGEVNGAMDVSETLDGGSSPKSRPSPATNNTVRPRSAAPRQ